MASEQAVEVLNNAKLATKAQQKVQHLSQLHELLVKNDPALLDTFVAELVEFQVDKAASVRRQLLELLSAAVAARPTAAVLRASAACLAALAGDEQVQVARQAAIAAHGMLRAGFALRVGGPQGDAARDVAWAAVQQLQASVCSLSSSTAAEVALCIAGIKLSEQAVLLYTSADAARAPAADGLAAAADGLIMQLSELLKEPGVQQQPGPVVVCVIKALGCVAMQQGQLMSKALPGLLELANKAIFKSPVPGDGQSCIAASCGAALKDMLSRIMRSNSDASRPWQQQLEAALRGIGADAVADSALRHIERAAARARAAERASDKRKAAEQGGPDAKVPRSATPAVPDSSAGNTPARTPTPTPLQAQQQQQQQQGGDVLSMLLPGGIARSADPTSDVQRVLEVLVAHQQQQAVETIISQISPEVLAELVLRWMHNLPPKPAADADAAPTPIIGAPAPGPAAAAAAVPANAAGAQQQQQQQQKEEEPDAAAAAAVLAAAAAQQQQQQQVVDPRRRAAVAGAAAAAADAAAAVTTPAAAPAAAAAASAAPQLPSPLPASLSDKQMQQLRQCAVQRILGATKNKPIRNFRELLLSRLASQAPQADGLSALMLQHVLGDYHCNRGHLLVVRWLYALAAALAAQTIDGSAAAAAAAEGEDGDAAAREKEGDEEEQAADADQQQQKQEGLQGSGDGIDVDMQEAEAEPAGSPATQQQQQQVDKQQRQRTSGRGSSSSSKRISSSSSSSAVQDLSGTQYEAVLLSVLQGLQQQLPASDPAIARLLQDAPVLPLQATLQFLQQLLQQGSGWAVLALDAAHSLIEGRPSMRQQLLQLVLQASVADEAATREHAVRLLVSQLIARESFAGEIVQFATAQLLLLLEPRNLLAARQQAEQQQQQPASDAAGSTAADGQQQQQQQVGEQPSSSPQVKSEQPDTEQQQQQQQQDGEQQAGKQEAAGADDQQQQQLEAEPELDVEVAAQQCMLFMSLCARKPELMSVLLETYGKAGTAARAGMDRYAASLARAITADSPHLLPLIKQPPEGSTELLLAMLQALTDASPPPQQLVAACVANFAASKDARLLAPVTPAMPKADVVRLLPQLVAQLSKPQLRLLYRRLATAAPGAAASNVSNNVSNSQPHFKPTELLVALHQLRSSAALRLSTKQQTAALDVALHAPEVFPVAVVVQAIRRLETLSPLPQLFMRTVISALQISPKLTDTVLELLKRLISKQIWTNEKQWQGFLICCEKAAPASYPVLLQLPPNILEAALEKIAERHWRELLKYATSKECAVPVFQPVRDVLNLFLERLTNRQKARLAAAAAAAAGGGSAAAGDKAAAAADKGTAAGAARAAGAAGGSKAAAVGTKGKAAAAAGAQKQPAKAPAKAADAAGGKASKAAAPAAAAQDQQQQQQQQQDDDGGGDEEFMLDFEDDE